tara:strand:- start:1804 stop:2778 length:975 start_codon:yes stop_codon:yes gene_type:complete
MKKIGKNLLFALLPSIILLFIIEFSSRVYYSNKISDWSYLLYGIISTELDGLNQPKIFKINESKKTNLKYDEYVENRNNDNYKHVFCVGASTTTGIDYLNNYPRYLNKYISRQYQNEDYLVHIIGKGHTNSSNFKEMISYELSLANPELLIIYCGYNDIFNKSIPNATTAVRTFLFLEKFSLFALLAKQKFYVLKQQWAAKEKNITSHQLSVDTFKKNIEDVIMYLDEREIKVILIPDVLDPRKFNVLSKAYENFEDRNKDIPNTLNQIAQTYNNVHFLNLYPIFDFKNPENDVHVDIAHLTKEGYDLLAKGVFDFIVKERFLE